MVAFSRLREHAIVEIDPYEDPDGFYLLIHQLESQWLRDNGYDHPDPYLTPSIVCTYCGGIIGDVDTHLTQCGSRNK